MTLQNIESRGILDLGIQTGSEPFQNPDPQAWLQHVLSFKCFKERETVLRKMYLYLHSSITITSIHFRDATLFLIELQNLWLQGETCYLPTVNRFEHSLGKVQQIFTFWYKASQVYHDEDLRIFWSPKSKVMMEKSYIS